MRVLLVGLLAAALLGIVLGLLIVLPAVEIFK